VIRVELGEEIERRGIWAWRIPALSLEGRSRQPLLDACRQIKRMGGATVERAGLFRKGRPEPDITVSVEAGAALTVVENEKAGPRFGRFREMPVGAFAEAAE
jgi:hypothetical protein